jgi:hypothetical protein
VKNIIRVLFLLKNYFRIKQKLGDLNGCTNESIFFDPRDWDSGLAFTHQKIITKPKCKVVFSFLEAGRNDPLKYYF